MLYGLFQKVPVSDFQFPEIILPKQEKVAQDRGVVTKQIKMFNLCK